MKKIYTNHRLKVIDEFISIVKLHAQKSTVKMSINAIANPLKHDRRVFSTLE